MTLENALEEAKTQVKYVGMMYQSYLDKSVARPIARWATFAVLLLLFMVRIVAAEGYYIVCYALFIFLLNLFLAFLTPRFDPSMQDDLATEEAEEGGPLPTTEAEANEFRPFIRRLPEFKFWLSATRATLIAFVCAFIPALDMPVFWPILVVYFFVLLGLTMRRQIKHMIKYHYIPFDFGKKRFSMG